MRHLPLKAKRETIVRPVGPTCAAINSVNAASDGTTAQASSLGIHGLSYSLPKTVPTILAEFSRYSLRPCLRVWSDDRCGNRNDRKRLQHAAGPDRKEHLRGIAPDGGNTMVNDDAACHCWSAAADPLRRTCPAVFSRCPCGVHFAEPPVLLVTSAKFGAARATLQSALLTSVASLVALRTR